MKVVFSFPVESLKGKVRNTAGMYFRKTGGIAVMQAGRTSLPEKTTAQSYIEGVFSSSMGAWNALPDATKGLWNDWTATEKPLSLSREEQISGTNAYRSTWIQTTVGRLTPPDEPPLAKESATIGALSDFLWRTSPGIWVIQVFSNGTLETGSKMLMEAGIPDVSATKPYRVQDMAPVNNVVLGGSIEDAHLADRWSLGIPDPAQSLVIGEWIWLRVTHWSPDWWPMDQKVYHTQLISD